MLRPNVGIMQDVKNVFSVDTPCSVTSTWFSNARICDKRTDSEARNLLRADLVDKMHCLSAHLAEAGLVVCGKGYLDGPRSSQGVKLKAAGTPCDPAQEDDTQLSACSDYDLLCCARHS